MRQYMGVRSAEARCVFRCLRRWQFRHNTLPLYRTFIFVSLSLMDGRMDCRSCCLRSHISVRRLCWQTSARSARDTSNCPTSKPCGHVFATFLSYKFSRSVSYWELIEKWAIWRPQPAHDSVGSPGPNVGLIEFQLEVGAKGMIDALDVGVGLKSTVGCYFMIITRVLQAVPITTSRQSR